MSARPVASILVISDYGGRNAEDWDYLRATLKGVAGQRFDGDVEVGVEVILVDSAPEGQVMPPDVRAIVPSMRIVGGPQTTRELLNLAVETATGDFVILLDGDCAPAAGWLVAALDAIRSRSDAAVVSGRTVYPNRSLTYRVLATLSRSFVDPGGPGRTKFISGNNAIFRRDVLVRNPLPAMPRAMAARLQTESIRAEGGGLYFEPRMRVTHRFDGWRMERRIRRNVGYRAVRVRQLDPRVPHAWMVRLGISSIPLFVAARTAESWWNCVRAGRYYGVRWYELPAALATAVAVHLLEIGGMVAAFTDGRDPNARLQ